MNVPQDPIARRASFSADTRRPKSAVRRWACIAFALLLALHSAFPAEPSSPAKGTGQLVQLRGRVICLAEEMHQRHDALLPSEHQHLWGFTTQDGTCYTLLRSKYSEALFVDDRLRQKELLLKAKLFPKSQVIEVTSIHSVRNGVVQDLYYYCDVCAIKSVSPEVCACCQGPVVLVEKPMRDREE